MKGRSRSGYSNSLVRKLTYKLLRRLLVVNNEGAVMVHCMAL